MSTPRVARGSLMIGAPDATLVDSIRSSRRVAGMVAALAARASAFGTRALTWADVTLLYAAFELRMQIGKIRQDGLLVMRRRLAVLSDRIGTGDYGVYTAVHELAHLVGGHAELLEHVDKRRLEAEANTVALLALRAGRPRRLPVVIAVDADQAANVVRLTVAGRSARGPYETVEFTWYEPEVAAPLARAS